MHSHEPETYDPFDDLFLEAEKSDQFWVSTAKLHFTEEMLAKMQELGMKKAELASRLGVKPAQITRLCGGDNNFTIETMVRVARALGCEFKSHLQPAGTSTRWMDFLNEEPIRPKPVGANWIEFKPITQGAREVESSECRSLYASSAA